MVILACQKKSNDHEMKWIDLSYAYNSTTPFWPTSEGFRLDTVAYGFTEAGYFYSAFSFFTSEHGGTHIDAPIHFAEGKRTVDEIPLDQLIGPGVVVDISEQCAQDIDYQITKEDIQAWESRNGQLTKGSIVLFRTGYGRFWSDKLKYMGTDQKGPSAVALLHFPGLQPEAAEWLVSNREVRAVGIDTPSIDLGRSSDFRTHRILMEQNIPAFENMANLDQLPEKGFRIIALPMKIKGGSGGPLRVIAGLRP
jgi:kynurenine formamidase